MQCKKTDAPSDHGKTMCGVELDDQTGLNDGCYGVWRYFTCDPGYGVFSPVTKVHFEAEYYSPHATAKRRADELQKQRRPPTAPGSADATRMKRLEAENRRLKARAKALVVGKKARPGSIKRQAAAADDETNHYEQRSSSAKGNRAYAERVIRDAAGSSVAGHRQSDAKERGRGGRGSVKVRGTNIWTTATERVTVNTFDDSEDEDDNEEDGGAAAHDGSDDQTNGFDEEANSSLYATPIGKTPAKRRSSGRRSLPKTPPATATPGVAVTPISAEQIALMVQEQVQAELARVQLASPDKGVADTKIRERELALEKLKVELEMQKEGTAVEQAKLDADESKIEAEAGRTKAEHETERLSKKLARAEERAVDAMKQSRTLEVQASEFQEVRFDVKLGPLIRSLCRCSFGCGVRFRCDGEPNC
jgi:hypothetical protein